MINPHFGFRRSTRAFFRNHRAEEHVCCLFESLPYAKPTQIRKLDIVALQAYLIGSCPNVVQRGGPEHVFSSCLYLNFYACRATWDCFIESVAVLIRHHMDSSISVGVAAFVDQ